LEEGLKTVDSAFGINPDDKIMPFPASKRKADLMGVRFLFFNWSPVCLSGYEMQTVNLTVQHSGFWLPDKAEATSSAPDPLIEQEVKSEV
jgi:hypothetical protein